MKIIPKLRYDRLTHYLHNTFKSEKRFCLFYKLRKKYTERFDT